MPHRFLRAVDPIVRHGIEELRLGLSIDHTLREVALMAALVGAGVAPTQAIRTVESREAELLGLPPGEAAERFHARRGRAYGMPYGKTCGTTYGKAPTGYGTGQGTTGILFIM